MASVVVMAWYQAIDKAYTWINNQGKPWYFCIIMSRCIIWNQETLMMLYCVLFALNFKPMSMSIPIWGGWVNLCHWQQNKLFAPELHYPNHYLLLIIKFHSFISHLHHMEYDLTTILSPQLYFSYWSRQHLYIGIGQRFHHICLWRPVYL